MSLNKQKRPEGNCTGTVSAALPDAQLAKAGKGCYKTISKEFVLHKSTVRQIVYKWRKFKTTVILAGSVFDYSYRDYILSWYVPLSRDEGQLYQMLSEDFWEMTKQLRMRLSEVDVVNLVCNDMVKTLHTHFCDLKAANTRLEEVPRPFPLHPCLRSPDEELHFLRCCARLLMLRLLPARDARSRSLRLLLVEVVATKGRDVICQLCLAVMRHCLVLRLLRLSVPHQRYVNKLLRRFRDLIIMSVGGEIDKMLKPLVDVLSDPDYINRMLLAQLEHREQVNEHHKKAYTYAPSYEEFIKLISSSSDIQFLKQLRDMGVALYHSYWQAAFSVSSLAAFKPLPSNQTEYPSNYLASPISLHQNIIETWDLVLLTHASK
ncbi:Sorting nexin-25 [Labeo rohita]|uniref:Sorting nexin-25 n=1 Tax=Labeo rohita TaxID=84645 RepID=A0ABQ8M364_LABRO|nr:Sorting nexin-25 [Labeo rohita]